jgi:hypothetical protein
MVKMRRVVGATWKVLNQAPVQKDGRKTSMISTKLELVLLLETKEKEKGKERLAVQGLSSQGMAVRFYRQ